MNTIFLIITYYIFFYKEQQAITIKKIKGTSLLPLGREGWGCFAEKAKGEGG
jgi:hypothetical protein